MTATTPDQNKDWLPHPLYAVPTREQCLALGPEATEALRVERNRLIALEAADPFRAGYEPAVWRLADEQIAELRRRFPVGVVELLAFGGNRASKSEWAAKRVVQAMVEKPKSRWICFQSKQERSIAEQQPLLWKYLPPEWRPQQTGKLRQGVTTNITYTQKGGFTESTFVLPNGSQCWFAFYSAEVTSLEGGEYDGAWLDELYTPEWLEAVRYRCVTRSGLILKTFTPATGYTPSVREELAGAKTLSEIEAELLPIYGEEEQAA